MTGLDLLVVTVTYNSSGVLGSFLDSLSEGLAGIESWHLAVADNASGDESARLVRERFPDATVVELPANRGYSAGINAAVAGAPRAGAVLVLNPDLTLAPGCGQALRAALRTPGTGIAVPRVLDQQGHQSYSLRREPSWLRAAGEGLLGGRRAGRWAPLGEMVTDPAAYQRPGTYDWATGAAMLVSAECWQAVGAWDESFFLYSEETDFALRARDRGWALRYTPDAAVVHRGGDAPTSPRLWSMLTTNRVVLYRRRHHRVAAAAFRTALVAGTMLRAVLGRERERAALTALLSPIRPPGPSPQRLGEPRAEGVAR